MNHSHSFPRPVLWLSRPLVVTAFVALFYLLFTLVALALHDGNPLWFVWIGERYSELDPRGFTGYDGQFIYYLAASGWDALPHLDNPPYRLQRIFLPGLVRLLSLDMPALVPWLIILINGVAIVITTFLLASWLREKQVWPSYALLYSLYVGTFMSYSRALTEPLALSLAAAGAIAWLRQRLGAAVLLLALALLTKETTLLFVFGIAAATLFRRQLSWAERARRIVAVLAAALPLLAWEAYLWLRLETLPLLAGPSLTPIPLAGILPHLRLEPGRLSAFLFVALPAAGLLIVALLLLRRHPTHPAPWWLLLHSVLVLLFPLAIYDHLMHAGRNGSGLVLAFVFSLAFLPRPVRLLAFPLWVAPTFVWLLPVLRWAPWLQPG